MSDQRIMPTKGTVSRHVTSRVCVWVCLEGARGCRWSDLSVRAGSSFLPTRQSTCRQKCGHTQTQPLLGAANIPCGLFPVAQPPSIFTSPGSQLDVLHALSPNMNEMRRGCPHIHPGGSAGGYGQRGGVHLSAAPGGGCGQLDGHRRAGGALHGVPGQPALAQIPQVGAS